MMIFSSNSNLFSKIAIPILFLVVAFLPLQELTLQASSDGVSVGQVVDNSTPPPDDGGGGGGGDGGDPPPEDPPADDPPPDDPPPEDPPAEDPPPEDPPADDPPADDPPGGDPSGDGPPAGDPPAGGDGGAGGIIGGIINTFTGGGGVVEILLDAPQVVTAAAEVVTEAVVEASVQVVEAVNTPTGSVVTKTITTTTVVTGAYVTASSALFLNPLAVSQIPLIPIRIWSLISSVLGLRRRTRPWGTVYDSVTKQPLDPAYVVLQDMNGEEISMSITDLDGRYGFLTQPGKYQLVANKTNYEFPSKKLAGKKSDELYDELYFGGGVEADARGVIIKNIPLDPIGFDWNEFAKEDMKVMSFYKKRDLLFARINKALFGFGFLVSVVVLFVAPAPYNTIIFVAYVALLIARHFGFKKKTFGSVMEKSTGYPLAFGIIRVFFAGFDKEVKHAVMDERGRYYLLIPNGNYYVTIEKKNLDETYEVIHTSEPFEVKNGHINQEFNI